LWSHRRWKHSWDARYTEQWVDEVLPPHSERLVE
jgi:hypothetical protein